MIKSLAGSLREYKKASLLTPLFVVCEIILEVGIPLLMANLIDFGIDKGNLSYIIKIGSILVMCALLTILFGALAGKFAAVASAGFAKNLRKDMFYNVQNFSFSNIDKFSVASIVTRLTTDVNNIQNAYMMAIRMAVRCPIMLVFSFVASFSIDTTLSLIFLAIIPFLIAGAWFIISKAHPLFRKVFKTYDELNEVTQENLRGIRVVKSFIREDYEQEKFGKISDKISKYLTKAEKTVAYGHPLMQFSMYVCMLLVSWIGARAIISSGNNALLGLSAGELLSLITYAQQILVSLMLFSMVFVMITMSKASAERVAEILEEKSDIVNCENPVYQVNNGDIKFDNVCFTYGKHSDKLCLNNINVDIKSGETIGIIGGTGSAKSTLVQLIPRLYDTNFGSVLVGGVNVKNYDIETLRNEVAMVLQKNVLFSGTIKENLRWGNQNATDEQLIKACQLAQADEFINKFPDGYDTYIEQGGSNVSGGQKQRLCIARALLKKPKILILDDSTSAVDTKTDSLIRDAFRKEIPNTTKIIIAQRISSVQDADKIIVLDDGKIVSIGTHNELINNCDIYKEVYNSQIKGGSINE